METRSLSSDGEETVARRVHENDFVFISDIGTVRIDAEEKLGFGIVNRETVAGEEKRCLEHRKLGFLLVAETLSNQNSSSHFH
uniref:Uncharacterized protein n=1 Tax=Nelumbo nucifera TaxID=4432 RepID=A0A822ZN64_NELNU|nr:TPA_asm: hypothetical protein HUJ06_003174 [Nelumbo nucifera]